MAANEPPVSIATQGEACLCLVPRFSLGCKDSMMRATAMMRMAAQRFSPGQRPCISSLPADSEASAICIRERGPCRPSRALCAEWDFSEMSPDMILIDGSRAAVRNAGQLRHVPTGRKESFAVMDIFHFEDGQCISLEEYADTWAILNLANPP